MKKYLITSILLGWSYLLMAQNITNVEYFIDTDPGFGLGTNVPVAAGSTVTANLNIPISAGLAEGFHKIYFRAKNATGQWSVVYQQGFYKIGSVPPVPNLVKLEYFIDTDPGFGQGTNVPVAVGGSLTANLNVPISAGLAEGFHKIYFRAKNATGQWSVVYQQGFYKIGSVPPVPNLVKLEYFIDTDPGFGQGTNVPLSQNNMIDLDDFTFSLPNSLSLGTHTFYLRSQNASGKWSIVAFKTFTNCDVGATISATPSPTSCGSPVTLNATIQNPNNLSLTWYWVKNYGNIGNDNQTSIQANSSGNYAINITAANNGGCTDITSNFVPISILGADSVRIKSASNVSNCDNPNLLEIDISSSAITTTEGVSYTWLRNNAVFASTPSITITQGGTYKLRINYLGGLASCTAIESNAIVIQDKNHTVSISPVSSFPTTIAVCSGSSILLNAQTDFSGQLTYQWFKDNVLLSGQNSSSLLISNAAGAYRVEVSSVSCAALSSIPYQVTFGGASSGSSTMSLLNGTLNSCPGETATLAVSGCSGEVEWNNGFVGATLNVVQLNQAVQYQAVCRTSCLSQALPVHTFTPTSPTLSAPILMVDDYPLNTKYTLAQVTPIFHNPDFQYLYNSVYDRIPHSFAALEGGRNYYENGIFGINALDKSQIKFFGEDIYAGVPNAYSNNIILLENDDLLLTGYTSSGIVGEKSMASLGGSDFWLLSKTINGTKVWDKSFGGTDKDYAGKTLKLSNGNLMICGTSRSGINGNKTASNRGETDFWIVITDNAGNYLADYSFGGSAKDSLTDAIILSNGNIALAGYTLSGVSGNKTSPALGAMDAWVVVITQNGTIVWENTFGTNGSEVADNIVEKNSTLYFETGITIYKVSLAGALLASQTYSFSIWAQPANGQGSYIVFQYLISKLLITPTNDLLVTGFYGGIFVDGVGWKFIENSFIFEITDNLSIITSTKTTFGDIKYLTPDRIHTAFFDSDAKLHLIKESFLCTSGDNPPQVDSPNFLSRCFSGTIRWHQFVVSKYNFRSLGFSDFCRGKEFLVKAVLPSEIARNIDFKWSNNAQGQIIKATPQERLPLYVTYKHRNQIPCGSPVAAINLLPYGDKLVLSGNNSTDANLKFAYKSVFSSENLEIRGNYKSEGSILLTPGFKISADNTKIFKAEIGGCNN